MPPGNYRTQNTKEENNIRTGTTIFTALAAILLAGMMIVPAMGLQTSSQDGSARTDAFEDTALQQIAQTHDIPIEQLGVVYKTEAHYRMIDKRLWCMKISDHESDEMYAVSIDMDGNIVDETAIEDEERRAYVEKYGKLEPELYDRLQGASGGELIKVGIWLMPIDSERIEKEVLSKIGEDKRTDGNVTTRSEIFAAKKEAYALKQKPVTDYLNIKGFEIIYTSFSAPLIFVELPGEEIIALEERDDVDKIYLSKLCEPESDTAVPTIKAPYVWNEGYDGSGTKVAIVEAGGVDFTNPYLSGIMRPSQSDVTHKSSRVDGCTKSNHRV